MFLARIIVKLKPSILDPQGKAVHHALQNLGMNEVADVRMGKEIEMWIDAATQADAERIAHEASDKLLANPVMEDFSLTIEKL